MEDLFERRQAELEFVAAAYSEEEAWCETESDLGGLPPKIYRRLEHESSSSHNGDKVCFLLQLEMPASYPVAAALKVSGSVQEERTSSRIVKAAFNALPTLLLSCRQTADDYDQNAEEAVFAVLSQADEWIQNEWPLYAVTASSDTQSSTLAGQDASSSLSSSNPNPNAHKTQSTSIILGRRLIYSHHIISKTKRADMKNLASHYKLTGYVKIGWPGIVILEGRDDDCNAFYDDMRKWAWKYLVVRGEMQEKVPSSGGDANDTTSVDSKRLFPTFLETDDMSIVANHCREVGLESLFRTSMKVYANAGLKNGDDDDDEEQDHDAQVYGALVHVDHMRDAKSYRKWLRKTCQDADVSLLIKQCYPNLDFTKRPKIVVGLLGDRESISIVLKKWRTTRVDVDSSGKACLERMMSVMLEGNLDHHPIGIDWDATHADESVNTAQEQLVELIESIGGPSWADAIKEL
jgi:hypothetical protein